MQQHSLIPGGLPGTRPSSAHPWSVQCPKEAKETRGGRDGGGESWRPPVQAVFLWVQAHWGSLPALQPPQHPPLPSLSSAREGVVALSLHPKLTVNFPNKGQFLHIRASLLPHMEGTHTVFAEGEKCSGGSLDPKMCPGGTLEPSGSTWGSGGPCWGAHDWGGPWGWGIHT